MNKKGAEWISYILVTGFFVSLSVMIILWAKGHTEDAASGTIKYMEGREECKMVFIDANNNSDCTQVNIKNKGTLTIKNFIVRFNSTEGALTQMEEGSQITGPLLPDPEQTISLIIPSDTSSVELLPIIEISNGQFASCTTKRLVVQCA
ncbi:MAG: hypothetical protein WC852_07005 [Candidatus Nanoarchaeia archaeon]|jgi:hypothetical protein